MYRGFFISALVALSVSVDPATAHAAPEFEPGASGAGDPYYPLDGNGGYDVDHYQLGIRYAPSSAWLTGHAVISAHATQGLSQFNLDLDGLDVTSVEVDGQVCSWVRDGGELVITPPHGLHAGAPFDVSVDYAGVPELLEESIGEGGLFHSADLALIIGEPHVASTWFPANDHPSDRASFTLEVSVPDGFDVAANGALSSRVSTGGWTTWTWNESRPMATYLVGIAIGALSVTAYEQDEIQYWDAIETRLFSKPSPPTGTAFAIATRTDSSYERLSRVISVPPRGAQFSFWVTRATEAGGDYFFVEAHSRGLDDWTTLPDLGGFATRDTGFACPSWQNIHPFLAHYQSVSADDPTTCAPSGSTGEWWAASGASDGAERWTIDLSAWAGQDVELSLSYASDASDPSAGVYVDDIVVTTGDGTTSFEDDGDVLDGWTIAAAPEGSPAPANVWTIGGAGDVAPSRGDFASEAMAREPEILAFLAERFGPYPFDTAGGVVTDIAGGFSMENQTRPFYAAGALGDAENGTRSLAHELAHQWFGDSLTLAGWQHIWLNEGFASYAEWLWSESEGLQTVQDRFDANYARADDDPFWTVLVGDPGPDLLFDGAIYDRGAMTLHQLRQVVGDDTFFDILEAWACAYAGENVSTDEFIALAEAVSGRDLASFFEAWLFVPAKPLLQAAGG